MPWKLTLVAATLITGFVSGWATNGWRLGAKIDRIQAQHAQGVVDAQYKARQAEKRLQNEADRVRRSKDAQILNLNRRVASLIDRVQSRPEGSGITANPRLGLSAQGCSGEFLYRPDAEFLIREAARADTIREHYKQCYKQYEEVRKEYGR